MCLLALTFRIHFNRFFLISHHFHHPRSIEIHILLCFPYQFPHFEINLVLQSLLDPLSKQKYNQSAYNNTPYQKNQEAFFDLISVALDILGPVLKLYGAELSGLVGGGIGELGEGHQEHAGFVRKLVILEFNSLIFGALDFFHFQI